MFFNTRKYQDFVKSKIIYLIIITIASCNPVSHYKLYSYKENNSYQFFDIIIPKIIMDTYRMRDFLSSDYYGTFKRQNGDLKAVDEMFDYALWMTDYNIEESTFIISIATLPYKKTPAKFPIFKFDMMFYFSLESDSMFKERYKNLPSQIFEDSPKNAFGDKDKLSHFFGTAYLAYISDSRWLPNLTGSIIELGEYVFDLEGFMDPRDLRTNKTGARFGLELLQNPETKPSKFLWKVK